MSIADKPNFKKFYYLKYESMYLKNTYTVLKWHTMNLNQNKLYFCWVSKVRAIFPHRWMLDFTQWESTNYFAEHSVNWLIWMVFCVSNLGRCLV